MMRVLVVDESKDDRRDVVDALGDLTNVVVIGAVSDLRGALRVLRAEALDVIVTEAKLPDGDAAHLLEAARDLPRAPQVVLFTGTPDAQRWLDAGASHHIPKEAGLRELQGIINELSRARPAAHRDPWNDPFRLLGRLAAGAAHDLNNYLMVIEQTLDLQQRRGGFDDPVLAGQTRDAVDAAARLTRTLLEYARGGAPAPGPVDLGELIDRTMRLLASSMPSEVKVVIEDAELPKVRGVAAELEQVVLNLALNAIDAMPRGGELRVSARVRGRSAVQLEVADTGGGPGRPSSAGDALSPSTKADRAGGGLGLGIVRAVVERHRGLLRIVPRPDGGTVVIVTLMTDA